MQHLVEIHVASRRNPTQANCPRTTGKRGTRIFGVPGSRMHLLEVGVRISSQPRARRRIGGSRGRRRLIRRATRSQSSQPTRACFNLAEIEGRLPVPPCRDGFDRKIGGNLKRLFQLRLDVLRSTLHGKSSISSERSHPAMAGYPNGKPSGSPIDVSHARTAQKAKKRNGIGFDPLICPFPLNARDRI